MEGFLDFVSFSINEDPPSPLPLMDPLSDGQRAPPSSPSDDAPHSFPSDDVVILDSAFPYAANVRKLSGLDPLRPFVCDYLRAVPPAWDEALADAQTAAAAGDAAAVAAACAVAALDAARTRLVKRKLGVVLLCPRGDAFPSRLTHKPSPVRDWLIFSCAGASKAWKELQPGAPIPLSLVAVPLIMHLDFPSPPRSITPGATANFRVREGARAPLAFVNTLAPIELLDLLSPSLVDVPLSPSQYVTPGPGAVDSAGRPLLGSVLVPLTIGCEVTIDAVPVVPPPTSPALPAGVPTDDLAALASGGNDATQSLVPAETPPPAPTKTVRWKWFVQESGGLLRVGSLPSPFDSPLPVVSPGRPLMSAKRRCFRWHAVGRLIAGLNIVLEVPRWLAAWIACADGGASDLSFVTAALAAGPLSADFVEKMTEFASKDASFLADAIGADVVLRQPPAWALVSKLPRVLLKAVSRVLLRDIPLESSNLGGFIYLPLEALKSFPLPNLDGPDGFRPPLAVTIATTPVPRPFVGAVSTLGAAILQTFSDMASDASPLPTSAADALVAFSNISDGVAVLNPAPPSRSGRPMASMCIVAACHSWDAIYARLGGDTSPAVTPSSDPDKVSSLENSWGSQYIEVYSTTPSTFPVSWQAIPPNDDDDKAFEDLEMYNLVADSLDPAYDAVQRSASAESARSVHDAAEPPTKRNLAESLKWYKVAAERGHAKAAFALSVFYEKGEAGERNPQEARRWLVRSAESGWPDAQRRLAAMSVWFPTSLTEDRAWWHSSVPGGALCTGLCCDVSKAAQDAAKDSAKEYGDRAATVTSVALAAHVHTLCAGFAKVAVMNATPKARTTFAKQIAAPLTKLLRVGEEAAAETWDSARIAVDWRAPLEALQESLLRTARGTHGFDSPAVSNLRVSPSAIVAAESALTAALRSVNLRAACCLPGASSVESAALLVISALAVSVLTEAREPLGAPMRTLYSDLHIEDLTVSLLESNVSLQNASAAVTRVAPKASLAIEAPSHDAAEAAADELLREVDEEAARDEKRRAQMEKRSRKKKNKGASTSAPDVQATPTAETQPPLARSPPPLPPEILPPPEVPPSLPPNPSVDLPSDAPPSRNALVDEEEYLRRVLSGEDDESAWKRTDSKRSNKSSAAKSAALQQQPTPTQKQAKAAAAAPTSPAAVSSGIAVAPSTAAKSRGVAAADASANASSAGRKQAQSMATFVSSPPATSISTAARRSTPSLPVAATSSPPAAALPPPVVAPTASSPAYSSIETDPSDAGAFVHNPEVQNLADFQKGDVFLGLGAPAPLLSEPTSLIMPPASGSLLGLSLGRSDNSSALSPPGLASELNTVLVAGASPINSWPMSTALQHNTPSPLFNEAQLLADIQYWTRRTREAEDLARHWSQQALEAEQRAIASDRRTVEAERRIAELDAALAAAERAHFSAPHDAMALERSLYLAQDVASHQPTSRLHAAPLPWGAAGSNDDDSLVVDDFGGSFSSRFPHTQQPSRPAYSHANYAHTAPHPRHVEPAPYLSAPPRMLHQPSTMPRGGFPPHAQLPPPPLMQHSSMLHLQQAHETHSLGSLWSAL